MFEEKLGTGGLETMGCQDDWKQLVLLGFPNLGGGD